MSGGPCLAHRRAGGSPVSGWVSPLLWQLEWHRRCVSRSRDLALQLDIQLSTSAVIDRRLSKPDQIRARTCRCRRHRRPLSRRVGPWARRFGITDRDPIKTSNTPCRLHKSCNDFKRRCQISQLISRKSRGSWGGWPRIWTATNIRAKHHRRCPITRRRQAGPHRGAKAVAQKRGQMEPRWPVRRLHRPSCPS